MATRLLLSSCFPVKPGNAYAMVHAMSEDSTRRIFVSTEEEQVLELRALDDIASLNFLNALLTPEAEQYAKYLAGDVRRELLSFVEAPKDYDSLLPDTPFIQLRHVEVKPEQMAAYRKWRDETIFDVVRSHGAAKIFLAYHSLISGQPGVMFVAGFFSSPDDYTSAFTSARYAEIVRQAGDTYITGGTEGLYTKVYRNPFEQAA